MIQIESFDELIKSFGFVTCGSCNKYNAAGKTFYTNNEFFQGTYWYYEGNGFYIDIHDFYVKKEYLSSSRPSLNPYMELISNYLISGNGEFLNPYQNISPNTMLVFDADVKDIPFILHANSHYFLVGIKYKLDMINEFILDKTDIEKKDLKYIFSDTRDFITEPLGKISKEIINCKMSVPSAELFFEAKSKEWLSIALDSFLNNKQKQTIPADDEAAIDNVTAYINDHFSFDISQVVLEKIAMMSGTKLKNTFKLKHNMSITEYTQRKRINFAENLLLTTNLDIKDIALSVGYSSPSRFSTLFKRYKGLTPNEIKNIADTKPINYCECNKND